MNEFDPTQDNKNEESPLYYVTVTGPGSADQLRYESSVLSQAALYRNALSKRLETPAPRVRMSVVYAPVQAHEVYAGVRVQESRFEKKEMRLADFSSAHITDTYFTNVDLDGASFSEARLENTVFENCTLQAATFESATLKNVDFVNCHLRGASLSEARLENVTFERTKANYLNASGATLLDCSFHGATFAHSDFSKSRLDGCYLNKVLLRSANLSDATFSASQFQRVNFSASEVNESSQFRHCRYESVNGLQDAKHRAWFVRELQRDNRERIHIIRECASPDPSSFQNHIQITAKTGNRSEEGICVATGPIANPHAPHRPIPTALIANAQGSFLIADVEQKAQLGQRYQWKTEVHAGVIRARLEAKLEKTEQRTQPPKKNKNRGQGR